MYDWQELNPFDKGAKIILKKEGLEKVINTYK